MNITLTGAAGRVGSKVCRHLVNAGHTVKAVDQVYSQDLPVPLKMLNLLQPAAAYEALEGAELLIHLANHPMFRPRESQRILSENVTMNMNVFQAAVEMGVRRIVFASSVQAFAHSPPASQHNGTPPPYLPLDGHVPDNPGNPYALSKVLSERMLRYFAAEHSDLSCVVLRLPGILIAGRPPVHPSTAARWTAPHEGFAFLDVRDAGTLMVALAGTNLAPGYRCYLPASRYPANGRPVPDLLREFYAQVPLRKPADHMDSLVDLSEIERDTGWTPAFNTVP